MAYQVIHGYNSALGCLVDIHLRVTLNMFVLFPYVSLDEFSS